MNYKTHSFRHAEVILNEPGFKKQYGELTKLISEISDNDIIEKHNSYGTKDQAKIPKSISKAINDLLKERLESHNWNSESGIFQDREYVGDTWRLDFAKDDISIEVLARAKECTGGEGRYFLSGVYDCQINARKIRT